MEITSQYSGFSLTCPFSGSFTEIWEEYDNDLEDTVRYYRQEGATPVTAKVPFSWSLPSGHKIMYAILEANFKTSDLNFEGYVQEKFKGSPWIFVNGVQVCELDISHYSGMDRGTSYTVVELPAQSTSVELDILFSAPYWLVMGNGARPNFTPTIKTGSCTLTAPTMKLHVYTDDGTGTVNYPQIWGNAQFLDGYKGGAYAAALGRVRNGNQRVYFRHAVNSSFAQNDRVQRYLVGYVDYDIRYVNSHNGYESPFGDKVTNDSDKILYQSIPYGDARIRTESDRKYAAFDVNILMRDNTSNRTPMDGLEDKQHAEGVIGYSHSGYTWTGGGGYTADFDLGYVEVPVKTDSPNTVRRWWVAADSGKGEIITEGSRKYTSDATDLVGPYQGRPISGWETVEYSSLSHSPFYTRFQNNYDYNAYTAVTSPASCSLDRSVTKDTAILSWSAGQAGTNNPISGYRIEYCESSDGRSWGAWTVHSTVGAVTSATVNASGTNGYYRKFRVIALGANGYDGQPSGESGTLRKNNGPAAITIRYPVSSGLTSWSRTPVFVLNTSSHPLGYAQSPQYALDGGAWTSLNNSRIGTCSVGNHSIQLRLIDSTGIANTPVSTSFTVASPQYVRSISRGTVISNPNISHKTDIVDMMSGISSRRRWFMSSGYALSNTDMPGGGDTYFKFSLWVDVMKYLWSRIEECYSLAGVTPPTSRNGQLNGASGTYPQADTVNRIRTMMEGV